MTKKNDNNIKDFNTEKALMEFDAKLEPHINKIAKDPELREEYNKSRKHIIDGMANIKKNTKKAKEIISTLGYFEYVTFALSLIAGIHSLYLDYLGKEEYIKRINKNWKTWKITIPFAIIKIISSSYKIWKKYKQEKQRFFVGYNLSNKYIKEQNMIFETNLNIMSDDKKKEFIIDHLDWYDYNLNNIIIKINDINHLKYFFNIKNRFENIKYQIFIKILKNCKNNIDDVYNNLIFELNNSYDINVDYYLDSIFKYNKDTLFKLSIDSKLDESTRKMIINHYLKNKNEKVLAIMLE